MSMAILHIGSNVGNSREMLLQAVKMIDAEIGTVVSTSSIYETEPWGVKDQDNFLNMALSVKTRLTPESILSKVKKIEIDMGRVETVKWGPRLIDIDILFVDDKVLNTPKLTLPHPNLQDRNFVLIPLMEIAGEMVHPTLHMTIEELYVESKDNCEVWLHDQTK